MIARSHGGRAETPRKLRELIRDLKRAGFVRSGGKGSHQKYKHPEGIKVTLSGNPGDDAKAYQELDVTRAIQESRGSRE